MRRRPTVTQVWPAPVRGLAKAGAEVTAPPDAAEVLDNFICTDRGVRVRNGAALHATVDDAVEALMVYRSGAVETLFAATAVEIFDVTTPADPEVAPASSVASLTSGDWSWTQFATSGGEFLAAVNGADSFHLYNGTSWQAITGVSSPALTGVATDDLSFVWSHKSRLWFIEKDWLSAWYLPVNSIAGAAAEFPLGSVMALGGSLLFGGTWSRDAGDGMDDLQVFVSTEGEVAVYKGTDPSSASTWALVGVYRIGRPLHKNAHFRSGGDLMVLTEDGIVSLSSAMQADRNAQQASAVTALISDLWRDLVLSRTPASRFPCALWPSRRFLLVGAPPEGSVPVCLAANSTSGAWSRITGWDARAIVTFGANLVFGDGEGRVCLADAGGSDLGEPYDAVCVPKAQDFGAPNRKFMLRAQAMFRGGEQFGVAMFGAADFSSNPPGGYPQSSGGDAAQFWGGGTEWGSGRKWGAARTTTLVTDWQAITGAGYSIGPGLGLSVARVVPMKMELLSMRVLFEVGANI